MKKIITLLLLTIIYSLVLIGCGNAKTHETKTKEVKTYNCSKIYETAQTQLENSILDEDTYKSLSDTLAAYEKKDVKKLSKKDAKKVKTICSEIESYYEASEQSIQDTLSQLGSVYPTDESFYDDTFKTNTTNFFTEFNALMDEGKYKEAGMKLNEITSAYTAYVKSKGQTVEADVSVTAEKTTKAKDQIVANKSTGKTTTANNSISSGNTGAGNSSANTGNVSSNNNVNVPINPGHTNTTSNSNVSNTAGSNNTPNKPSTGSNKVNTTPNNNFVTEPTGFVSKTYVFGPDVDGSGTNQAYCTSQAEYDAAYNVYMQHVKEMEKRNEEREAEAAAFEYVTNANVAYQQWCESPECDATIPFDTWLNTHGYNAALYHQYCNKYGW